MIHSLFVFSFFLCSSSTKSKFKCRFSCLFNFFFSFLFLVSSPLDYFLIIAIHSLHKKLNYSLGISSVNVTKSAVCGASEGFMKALKAFIKPLEASQTADLVTFAAETFQGTATYMRYFARNKISRSLRKNLA